MRRQFMIYVSVGVATAVVDLGTMQALLALGLHYQIAVSIAFALALGVNYTWHKRYTFQARHSHGTMLRYGFVVALNYLLTLACVQLSVNTLDSVMLGKLASLPLVAVHGFLWGRYWVFRGR
jgi:putative flippase GtrA